jgi:hypothetical protein
MTRVQFPFGDGVLAGEVVERRLAPRAHDVGRSILIVETGAGRYRTLARDAQVLEP